MVTAPADMPSRRMAQWAAGLDWRDVPAEVAAQVPLRVLDTTGLALAAERTEAVRAAATLVESEGGSGRGASVLGGGARRVPPGAAAMVHGVAAHCRDFDDTFTDSVVHTGSVVVPAALAMAETVDASDETFGAAIVAGYEVAARIGAVAGRRFHARSLHATGVVGPIAAAVTAGRVLGLTGEQMSWAMGLAASMSGGLMAFTMDGGWSKWLHAGWAAKGGITAAQLAARGFRGPEYVLQGGHDLYTALLHGEPIDHGVLTDGLGATWLGARSEFKYYPCAHVIHPYIDAVLELVMRHDLRPDDIDGIECGIAPWAAAIVAEPREARLRFGTELEAIASLFYQLAMAVVERRVDLAALEASQRSRADVAAMAARITHQNDPSLGKGFDGNVEIRTKAGQRWRQDVKLAGPDAGRLQAKFAAAVAGADPAGEAAARRTAASLMASGRPDWRRAAQVLAAGAEAATRA